MKLAAQVARHFREIHFGGNWTTSCLKDVLADVSWQQATTRVQSFNTIAALVFHTHYFVAAVLNVLKGGPLEAHDKYSFDVPPITSQQEWDALLQKVWADADEFAALVEQLPDLQMWSPLADEKYGTWYRNLHGIIEHSHYHLGQIVIIKKLLP